MTLTLPRRLRNGIIDYFYPQITQIVIRVICGLTLGKGCSSVDFAIYANHPIAHRTPTPTRTGPAARRRKLTEFEED
jgi:hypothetical protein